MRAKECMQQRFPTSGFIDIYRLSREFPERVAAHSGDDKRRLSPTHDTASARCRVVVVADIGARTDRPVSRLDPRPDPPIRGVSPAWIRRRSRHGRWRVIGAAHRNPPFPALAGMRVVQKGLESVIMAACP
jgi:hypothetical protein